MLYFISLLVLAVNSLIEYSSNYFLTLLSTCRDRQSLGVKRCLIIVVNTAVAQVVSKSHRTPAACGSFPTIFCFFILCGVRCIFNAIIVTHWLYVAVCVLLAHEHVCGSVGRSGKVITI